MRNICSYYYGKALRQICTSLHAPGEFLEHHDNIIMLLYTETRLLHFGLVVEGRRTDPAWKPVAINRGLAALKRLCFLGSHTPRGLTTYNESANHVTCDTTASPINAHSSVWIQRWLWNRHEFCSCASNHCVCHSPKIMAAESEDLRRIGWSSGRTVPKHLWAA